jgi:hypothetical protein
VLIVEASLARSSQLRVVYLNFIDKISTTLSSRLFQESYALEFLNFLNKETVPILIQ